MATWAVKPKTVGSSLAGAINYDDIDANWRVWQDEKPYVDMVKQERETHSNRHTHVKKFATVPDIVAMEILQKYGLDLHAPEFMHDKDAMKKLKAIIVMDYPHLVVST